MSLKLSVWAWDQACGNQVDKAVLLCLADQAGDEHNTCWPSQGSISARVECSHDTVARSLARLEEKGFITREERYRKTGDGGRTSDLITIIVDPAEREQLRNKPGLTRNVQGGGLTRTVQGAPPQDAGYPPRTLRRQEPIIRTNQGTISPTPCGAGTTDCPEAPEETPPSSLTGNSETRSAVKGVPFPVFWAAYPKKVGKAKAEKKWKRMSADDQIAAYAAIEPYKRLEKCQNGFVMQGDTFLNSEAWKDFAATAAEAGEQAKDQLIKAVALDLVHEEDVRVKAFSFASREDVKRKAISIYAAAVHFARTELDWTPKASFAAAA